MPDNKAKFSSIREFMVRNSFVSVHNAVRVNTNDYAFVTFIDKDNKAENIYFSKTASLLVAKDTPVDRDLFSQLVISEYINENGEPRVKLATQGDSSRISVEDLF